jgi:AcrR family transcriptional regulator
MAVPAVLRKNLGVDERVLRTRANIADAVIRIGQERGVDDLTVGELVREAGISRSTFYAHFGSLEHYLSQSFANMVEGMAAHGAYDAGPGDTRLLHVRQILDHIAGAGRFADVIAHSRHRPRMLAAGEERLRKHVDGRLIALRPAIPENERAALARFVAAGFIAILRSWMERGRKQSPEAVQRQFDEIVDRL